MNGSTSGSTKVTVEGHPQSPARDSAVSALCAAIDRTVQTYRPAGFRVREIVVKLEEGAPVVATPEPTPVYVDVYDSGYGHGI